MRSLLINIVCVVVLSPILGQSTESSQNNSLISNEINTGGRVIAVLPFFILLDPYHYVESSIMRTSTTTMLGNEVQALTYEYLMAFHHHLNVNVQDIYLTNSILTHNQISDFVAENSADLCSILGVDAIMVGMIASDKKSLLADAAVVKFIQQIEIVPEIKCKAGYLFLINNHGNCFWYRHGYQNVLHTAFNMDLLKLYTYKYMRRSPFWVE